MTTSAEYDFIVDHLKQNIKEEIIPDHLRKILLNVLMYIDKKVIDLDEKINTKEIEVKNIAIDKEVEDKVKEVVKDEIEMHTDRCVMFVE